MLPEKIIADTAVELIKNNHSGVISYFLHNWFGGAYQKYLKNKILIPQMAEIDAKKELLEKYPYSDIALVNEMRQAEIELEYINMAGVLSKLDGKISEKAEGDIDPDKMKRLKDLSKEYSSEEMQEYIAKILAGEYNKSGTYSLQTLEVLKSISKEELEIFQKFKKIIFGDGMILEKIFSDTELMKRFNIAYKDLLLLNSLGLISMSSSSVLLGTLSDDISLKMLYNGNYFSIKWMEDKKLNSLYYLTRSGSEIASLLQDDYSEDFMLFLKEYFKENNIELITEKVNFN